ncbi:MATE family efflux transporter [Oceanotoga sp. DSM 15011]|uniref:Multidrug-efflux transporter n=1 Tax=Oceanotoga teriensis TaxID=515440 RepID=A0AA45C4E0_9BACT|nr:MULTISPECIES: MATE family efflux transporter [Oceanotoga]MDN5341882.1 hypothetical protein [Oceanotoga sp.]PWJ85081.1 putative MATE family efflux protein [Oceanotoga teriensis]UYP00716.1 MATE family efflux transporter [Oceanotoga sp. DSM 15011]
MESKSKRLGTDSILSLMIKLSIPSIIGMSIQALYNVVDSIYIGRLSKEALSALSLAFPIQMILIAIAVGTGIGATSLISRLLGEMKEKKADNVAENVIFVTIFYSIIVFFIGLFFSDELIKIFTSNIELINLGKDYIQIIMIGSIAMFLPIIANSILRGEGNTFIPMISLIVGAVINIFLDPFLIFGLWIFPAMGVKGAALATVISRFISGILVLIVLFYGKNQIKFDFKNFNIDFDIIKEVYRVGLPAMIMQLLGSFMIAGANKIVASFNQTAIAVVGIYFRLQSFVFMPVFGLNQGYIPIIGYNFGHKNPERLKKAIFIGLITGFIFTTIGFFLLQFFPEELIRMFNDDPELIKIGVNALKIISIAFPIIGLSIVGSATFQAVGKGLPSLIISFLRQIVLLLPLMYILSKEIGLKGTWYAFPISEFISFFIMVIWFYKTMKKIISEMRK